MSDQVSSLKKSRSGPSLAGEDDDGLGIENGSFKWNEVEESKDQQKPDLKTSTSSLGDETDTAVGTQSNIEEPTDHHFELRDISVSFPEGELSVITGPTASGKTALLVSLGGLNRLGADRSQHTIIRWRC